MVVRFNGGGRTMMKPTCEEIQELAKDYDVVPLCKEIYADIITPIGLIQKIAKQNKRYYLLESIEGGETWGRYSFIGYNPVMRVFCKNGIVTIEEGGTEKEIETKNPLQVIRDIMKKYRSPRIEGFPSFTGGFVGNFAYSMIGYTEPTLKIKSGDFKDYDLMMFKQVIAYDHLKQKICIIVNMQTDQVMKNYGQATATIESIVNMIKQSDNEPIVTPQQEVKFTCNVSQEEYCDMVEKTKEYICKGDIFQAVISRQFKSEYKGSLLNAYRVLRTTNPSPYMVYMRIDDEEIMSTSPETLVKLTEGRLITFPIAGSRPRGKTSLEDKQLEEELLRDEKELAEHNMLVDLGRNDIGKISKYGSVEVTKYMLIHKYMKIMHICSQVEGDINPQYDGLDAIEAVLPAGTLSGAPKIRACEIIEQLEGEPRGIYGGALGYLDFAGNLDTCIAIRMAVKKDDKVHVQAGAGIVADSVPGKEYEESENKAKAVMNAICNAQEVND